MTIEQLQDEAERLADAPDASKVRAPSAARIALDRLIRAGAEFFHSPDDKAWVRLEGRNYLIDDKKGCRPVEAWLTQRGSMLIGNARSDLKDLMIAHAHAGPSERVHFRQADGADQSKPEAFLNLMDGKGAGIHVDATGWRVGLLSSMPVTMADRAKALPLPMPVRANDGLTFLDRLARHFPMDVVQAPNDPNDNGVQQRTALLAFCCAQVSRPGAAPLMMLSAAQGAGKTTAARRLKDLTDPMEWMS